MPLDTPFWEQLGIGSICEFLTLACLVHVAVVTDKAA